MKTIASNYQQKLPSSYDSDPICPLDQLPEELPKKIFKEVGVFALSFSSTNLKYRKIFIQDRFLLAYHIACKSLSIAKSIRQEKDKDKALCSAVIAMADLDPERALEDANFIHETFVRKQALLYINDKIVLLTFKKLLESADFCAESLKKTNIRIDFDYMKILISLIGEIAVKNLDWALKIVNSIDASSIEVSFHIFNSFVYAGIAKVIAPHNLEKALDLIDSITDRNSKEAAVLNILKDIDNSKLNEMLLPHFDKLLKFVISSEKYTRIFSEFVRVIAKVDPGKALEIYNSKDSFKLKQYLECSSELSSIIKYGTATYKKEIKKAIELLENENEKDKTLTKLVKALIIIDPEEAFIEACLINEPCQKKHSMLSVLEAIVNTKGLERAYELLEHNHDQEIRDLILGGIVKVIAKNTPEIAEKHAGSIVNLIGRAEGYGFIAGVIAENNLDKAMSFADLFVDEAKWFILIEIINAIAKKNTEKALEIAFALIKECPSKEESILSKIAFAIAYDQPEQALKIIDSMNGVDFINKSIIKAKLDLMIFEHDPEKAIATGSYIDKGKINIIRKIAKTDMPRALKLANSFKNPLFRAETLASLAKVYTEIT